MSRYRVLIAEDEAIYAKTVARYLKERGHEVRVCATGRAAERALKDAEWDVLVLDLKLPDARGIELLARVRQDHAGLETIIVTGFANVESAIEAMRLGAFDYLTKPPNFGELAVRVERAGEKALLERENLRLRFQMSRALHADEALLTRSTALREVITTLERVAAATTPVLIEGESGVGKELLAQHLHRVSPRGGRAFVDLNCSAVAAPLLESELFGHEKGAFTGAEREKPGLVEVADGGTLFLDEVGEMAPELQTKLLRVLDTGTFYRVGATRKRRADFRLVAATNRDLKQEMERGRFRKDLYYRIRGVRVVAPPLRARPEDIPLLAEAFAERLPAPKRLSRGAITALQAHDWPGNVRELRFAVERAGLLAAGDTIDAGDLPPEILERGAAAPTEPAVAPAPDGPVATPDAGKVRAALERARWRRSDAAKLLGVSPRTLHRWMKRLGL